MSPRTWELKDAHRLFASVTSTLDRCSGRVQEGFYDLGAQILEVAYKGTSFDETMTIHAADSDGGNFDIAMDTSEN